MIVKILTFLLNLFFKKLDIAKGEGDNKVIYLRRWYLWKGKKGQVFLHQFFRSDDDPDPHSHPWSFTSIVLKGGYVDEQYGFVQNEQGTGHLRPGFRYFKGNETVFPFSIVRRGYDHIHRVVLNSDGKGGVKPAWSLIFTGGYEHEWGFIKQDAWVYWRDYLGVHDGPEI